MTCIGAFAGPQRIAATVVMLALLTAGCGASGDDAAATTTLVVDDPGTTLAPSAPAESGTEHEGDDTGAPSATDSAPAPADVDLDRTGSLSLTVPGVSSRTEGACFFDGRTRAVFAADDGRTRLDLQRQGDARTASGELTFDVEGDEMTWAVSATSSHAAMELAPGLIYYEGDFVIDGETVFGVIQMTCE